MADWPHSPVHRLSEAGAYMVSAATYLRRPVLTTASRLTVMRDTLFTLADRFAWSLQAWTVIANHYHFVAIAPADAESLRRLVQRLHSVTARALNAEDRTPGRRVWFQYWDSHVTFERSYLARLRYVHENPVHHGLVTNAEHYPWCSAAWFAREAEPPFYRTVMSFPINDLNVFDVE